MPLGVLEQAAAGYEQPLLMVVRCRPLPSLYGLFPYNP